MHRLTKIPIVMLNPMLTCKLCGGYLIDATTVVECLHSFCRSCLLGYLKLHTTCPVCDTVLHKTRPHYAIRSDRALQAIVYKLIPNLFEKEMSCRRDFFRDHPDVDARSLSPEKKGEVTVSAYVPHEEEHISVELAYWQPNEELNTNSECNQFTDDTDVDCRSTYLLCPPELTVAHLEKLIRVKFGLEPNEYKVVLFFTADDLFNPDYTLSDLACLYAWRRLQPLKLFFTILGRCILPSTTSTSSILQSINSKKMSDAPVTVSNSTNITNSPYNCKSRTPSSDWKQKPSEHTYNQFDSAPSKVADVFTRAPCQSPAKNHRLISEESHPYEAFSKGRSSRSTLLNSSYQTNPIKVVTLSAVSPL